MFCLFSRACRPTVPFIGRQRLCFHSFNFLLFLQSMARACCILSGSVCGIWLIPIYQVKGSNAHHKHRSWPGWCWLFPSLVLVQLSSIHCCAGWSNALEWWIQNFIHVAPQLILLCRSTMCRPLPSSLSSWSYCLDSMTKLSGEHTLFLLAT